MEQIDAQTLRRKRRGGRAGSVWFNQKDVAAVAWDVRGDWLYSESTGRAKTRFRLTTAWTGEPYSGLRYDCPDGTHGVGEISIQQRSLGRFGPVVMGPERAFRLDPRS